jgi:hypothetical protein
MRHSLGFAALAALTVTVPSLAAQAPSLPPAPHACFRGRPLAECDGFWITEFTVAKPLSNSGDEIDRLPLFTWELGGMKNVGPRSALGATLLLEQSGLGYQRTGLAPRFRYWVTPDLPIDLSGGLTTKGWLGRAGVSFGDYLGASLQAEGHANPWGNRTTTWYLGGRLGAGPGLVAGGAVLAFLVVGTAMAFR